MANRNRNMKRRQAQSLDNYMRSLLTQERMNMPAGDSPYEVEDDFYEQTMPRTNKKLPRRRFPKDPNRTSLIEGDAPFMPRAEASLRAEMRRRAQMRTLDDYMRAMRSQERLPHMPVSEQPYETEDDFYERNMPRTNKSLPRRKFPKDPNRTSLIEGDAPFMPRAEARRASMRRRASIFGVSADIIGGDGNAFAILGTCMKAAKRAGVSQDEIDQFYAEATSGDYDNLLRTVMKYFDVPMGDSDYDEDSTGTTASRKVAQNIVVNPWTEGEFSGLEILVNGDPKAYTMQDKEDFRVFDNDGNLIDDGYTDHEAAAQAIVDYYGGSFFEVPFGIISGMGRKYLNETPSRSAMRRRAQETSPEPAGEYDETEYRGFLIQTEHEGESGAVTGYTVTVTTEEASAVSGEEIGSMISFDTADEAMAFIDSEYGSDGTPEKTASRRVASPLLDMYGTQDLENYGFGYLNNGSMMWHPDMDEFTPEEAYGFIDFSPSGETGVHIDKTEVREKGKGHGTQMLDEFEDYVGENGWDEITLYSETPEATKFWKGRGYSGDTSDSKDLKMYL